MALLRPKSEKFIHLNDGNGTVIGIFVVTILSSSDTLTVPDLSQTATDKNATNIGSSAMLLMQNGNTVTSITDNANSGNGRTITITGGTPGQDITIVASLHPNMVNYST
jgi:hypothetical protein